VAERRLALRGLQAARGGDGRAPHEHAERHQPEQQPEGGELQDANGDRRGARVRQATGAREDRRAQRRPADPEHEGLFGRV
jgi:hypothetical protein